jgi:ATP-dependent exoDNAse (exonuclease V) beta subunit
MDHGAHQSLLSEDAESRARALDANESFIIEAPAGAGKTELLTQRFLRLLQTVSEPEEIVAITFTNKAASEMRARVLDSLQDAVDAVPVDKAHKQETRALALNALRHAGERGWQLLENPARLRIYTIDSFSSHLARQMPLMSRFGAQPGVRDDATPYYEEAATRTLDLLESEGTGEIVQQALRYFDNDAYRLNRLLAEMLAKRDQWLDYTQDHATPQIAEDALGRMIVQDIRVAAAMLTSAMQQRLMPLARYAASNLPCEEPIALLRDWETPLALKPEALPMWRAVCDLLLTGKDHKGSLRKALNKNQGLPATPEAKPYKEQLTAFIDELRMLPGAEQALAGLRLLPDARHEDEVWQIIATLGRLLKLAAAQLWLVFQSSGEVDFVEVAQRALKALEDDAGNPTDLALKLDYRIQHLLVDEFQDTSPTQIKLLQRITRGWQPGDGRTLFLVGDPMQSIYRFRKANVGLFLRVAEEGVGDLQLVKLRLWRNNRSCPPVIDWINHAFEKVFPQQDSDIQGAIRYRSFAATKADEAGAGVKVHALIAGVQESDTDDEDEAEISESADGLRQREADRIIEIIRQTRAENPEAKIAVLVRARNHLHALVSRIRRHHPRLSFQAVEIEELANRQIVQDLLSLTNALHHRADRVHWLAILRAPWCGLTLADLHALAGHHRNRTIPSLMHDESRLNDMSENGRARLLHVRNVLDEALAQRGRQSTARWVHGVWLMLGGPDCLWEPGDVRDVQAFFERIAKLEAGGQFTPEQLAIEVQKLYAAPDAEADDHLQFMTIHKSKGLEFDSVILPGLDRKIGGNDQPLLLWEEVPRENALHDAARTDLIAAPLPPGGQSKSAAPSPYSYLKHLERTRAGNEDARVLYVAATRAERCLHLLGAARRNDKGELKAPKGSFLELLWPHVHAEFAAAAEAGAVVTQEAQSGAALADFVPRLVRLAEPGLPPVFAGREQKMAAVRRGSETQAEEPAGDSVESLDRVIGILAHRYLEFIAKQGLAAWPHTRIASLKPAMLKWLQRQGVKAEMLETAAARTVDMLQTTLASEDGRWLLMPRAGASAELPVSTMEEDDATTQRLDLTFVEDGVRWIIDYKSTQLSAELSDAQLSRQAETHRPQLQGYSRLFETEGLPVITAIFFLSVGRLVRLQ